MKTAKLIINSTWCRLSEYPLAKSVIRIGRTPDNDIVFSHQCVSRAHAIISRRDGEYVIEDLGSKHGTFVNKERIREKSLKSNDVIHLGLVRETEMRVSLMEDDTSSTPRLQWFSTMDRLENLEFQQRDLQVLLDIARAINSTLVLEDVLNLVMDAVLEITRASNGYLLLYNELGELEVMIARNQKKQNVPLHKIRLSNSIIKNVAESGKPIISGNMLSEEQFKAQQSVLELQIKTVMCVPLKIVSQLESKIIGVIYVDHQVITQKFSKKTMDMLDYMASHAAIAIENARLLEETKIKERMKKELEIAYEIQTSLLPRSFPEMPQMEIYARSEPAMEVGGDFYFFLPLGEKKLNIAIGDVTGKSVPAALYMSATLSSLDTLLSVKNDLNPSDVLATLNAILCKKIKESSFVTCFFGCVDLEANKFIWSNAGHPYPILIRGSEVRELVCNGTALGVFADDGYQNKAFDLNSDDYLILISDGIVESLNENREMFGFHRLMNALQALPKRSATQLGEALFHVVERFSKEAEFQFDDMTLICIHIL